MQSHRARAESVREMRSHGSGAESRRKIGFVGARKHARSFASRMSLRGCARHKCLAIFK